MKIKIDRLKEGDNTVSFEPDEITSLDIADYSIISGTSLKLYVVKNHSYVHITGSNEIKVEETCDRCGEKYSPLIKVDIDYVFHLGDMKKENSEGVDIIRPEENDGYIIFDHYYTESFYLTLPLKKLCDEDCKGLCSECGVNLNSETCSCGKEEKIDPRWEKLAELAKKSK